MRADESTARSLDEMAAPRSFVQANADERAFDVAYHRASMSFAIDLERYLERIDHRGPTTPNRGTLDALVRAHVQAIPFENLDVLLGRGVDIDPAAIERKLVTQRRGGYCFEQNTLLMHALEALGFHVEPISARVRIGRPRDFVPARTHMFLRVELDDGSWLADVGVGGLSPTAALKLEFDREQKTPHETRRLQRDGAWSDGERRDPRARLFHQAFVGGEWVDVCEFTLEAMHPIDRETANWYTSTHPRSHFRDRLMVARATPDGRATLLNRDFTLRRAGADPVRRTLQTPAELLELLAEQFGLEFPPNTRFECAALDWPS